MTRIQRWLETGQAPPDVLKLLQEARPPKPLDPAIRRRTRRRLVAMTTVPTAVGAMLWFKSVALGAIIGGAATAVVLAPEWPTATPSVNNDALDQTHRRSSVMRRKAEATANVAPSVSSAVPSALLPPTAASDRGSSRKAAPQASAQATDDFAREVRLLENARQLLSAAPSRALSTLDEHQREFGEGTLAIERQFLQIDALLRLGRHEEARLRAAELRARAPGSLYERRLIQLLGDSSE